MMRRLLPLLLLACVTLGVRAEQVTPKQARVIADRVLQTHTRQAALPADLQEMYLFVADEGFVIVAADDRVRPVLAYGEHWLEQGDSLPAALHDWLSDYDGEIALLRERKVEASDETRAEWQRLMGSPAADGPVYTVVVTPMLSTTWGQSPYYNNLCPSGCVAGCVATATAQVMKYWNHPMQGTGSHSYIDGDHGQLSANFGNTTYQWSQMPAALTGSSSSAQVNAVATLIYHLGVAMEMEYGSSSSATTGSYGSVTSVCAENAMKTYFGYARSMHHVLKGSMDDALWCALIDVELAAARPVIYSGRDVGGGHCFVLDGCNNAGQYHFNWGWKGYCDGYYVIGQLNPSPGGTGGTSTSSYNLKNGALMGVRPAPSNPPATCTVSVTLTDAAHASVSDAGSHSYGDTVSVKINTQAGYRFTRWSDGVHYNPRKMVLDSSMSLTAIVENISASDTVYYANSYHSTTYGAGGTYYWGLKLTAADLARFSHLHTVQVYDKAAGDYELRIYRGGNSSPSTLIHMQDVTFTGAAGWMDVVLDSALTIDRTMPLWVTFYNSGVTYPAAAATYGGNGNGSMRATGSGSSWSALSSNYSFMIRAVFTSMEPCEAVREELFLQACDSYTWNDNLYTVSVVDSVVTAMANGCDSTTVLHLTIDYSIDTIIYDTAVGSYQWNGETYRQSGVYLYQGETTAACDSTVTLHLTITSTEGIGDVASRSVQLYPNPVDKVLIIDGLPQKAVVKVYDLAGREQASFTARDSHSSLDVTQWASGVYLLSVGNTLYRFVVKY